MFPKVSRTSRRPILECLECRTLLTAFGFVSHDIPLPDSRWVGNVAALDVDKDGDEDIAYQIWDDVAGVERTAWHENFGGDLNTERRIDMNLNLTMLQRQDFGRDLSGVEAVDFEDDGDLDYLGYASGGSELYLYENDGLGGFIETIVTTPEPIRAVSSATSFDQNSDRALDLVFTASVEDDSLGFNSPTFIWWMEKVDGEGYLPAQKLIEAWLLPPWHKVELVDVDGDGDIDVLCNCASDPSARLSTVLLENTGAGFNQNVLGDFSRVVRMAYLRAVDWDADGELEIFTSAGGSVSVYDKAENGKFEQTHSIELPFTHIRGFDFGEFNGDGLPDLVVRSYSQVVYFDQLEQPTNLLPPNFGPTFECGDLAIDDLDGDGRRDVLLSAGDNIRWSDHGETMFEPIAKLHGCGWKASLATGDIDNDGDIDIVSTSRYETAVHENVRGSFVARSVTRTETPQPVLLADFDGDENLDLVTFSQHGYVVILNKDGDGEFTSAPIILDSVDHVLSLDHGDIDGDGDQDILFVGEHGRTYWLENEDNGSAFNFLDKRLGERGSIVTEDFDETFGAEASLGDLDGDGDEDVVVLQENRLEWFENDGNGTFGVGRVVDTVGIGPLFNLTGNRLAIVDFDGDNDLDLITSKVIDDVILPEIVWYENDSAGSFSAAKRTGIDDGARRVHAEDMDGDGDIDIVAESLGEYHWYENKLTGDADDDGEVSFADFLVLSSNFGAEVDAVWEDGDFDGDGAVSFADFLLLSANFGNA